MALANGEGDGYQPKVVELLLGTNNLGPNTPAETIVGERAVLDDLRKRFPGAKILVLGIFPRGRPTDSIRKDVATVNDALARMADEKTVFYLDISKVFLNDDGTTNDGLEIRPPPPLRQRLSTLGRCRAAHVGQAAQGRRGSPKTAATAPDSQPKR